MKFLILATTITSLLGSATANWGCNNGWSGDGSCERAGRYTFCVSIVVNHSLVCNQLMEWKQCRYMDLLTTDYIYEFQHQKKVSPFRS